jgi:hypothetical protein
MTSMMFLTAHSMYNPQHENWLLDEKLVDTGLLLIGRMADETDCEVVRSFQETCSIMHQNLQQQRKQGAVPSTNTALPYPPSIEPASMS